MARLFRDIEWAIRQSAIALLKGTASTVLQGTRF
jgi:hypothetical protein